MKRFSTGPNLRPKNRPTGGGPRATWMINGVGVMEIAGKSKQRNSHDFRFCPLKMGWWNQVRNLRDSRGPKNFQGSAVCFREGRCSFPLSHWSLKKGDRSHDLKQLSGKKSSRPLRQTSPTCDVATVFSIQWSWCKSTICLCATGTTYRSCCNTISTRGALAPPKRWNKNRRSQWGNKNLGEIT